MQIGKYQLIHKLATGGMAEVFLAKAAGPMGFEKLLVVKRILPHLATEPTFVDMFLSEARLAAQLNHPNIVQIFDFGEAEGTYFIAMEYIDGPNLRELVKRASGTYLALPLVFCARIIASACEGLSFAHDFRDPATRLPMNVVHRDISPDNILLSRQGAVKVVDFGIAKAAGVSPHTQTGVLKGKLAYMPPEQLRNEPLDRRADVYALGVVLYELLTGLKPFVATSEAGMVQAILFQPQVPVEQLRPDVPDSLQRILGRALAKEREKRYPDCASFQAELEEFILSSAKTMGASQLAQLVCMLTAGLENPTALPQAISSGRSNLGFSQAQPPIPLLPPLEATAMSLERPPVELSPGGGMRRAEGREGELTSAARPSRLIARDGGRIPQGSGPPLELPAEPGPPRQLRSSARETIWAVGLGTLLVLAGGGYLSQRSSLWPRQTPPSPLPAAVAPPPASGSAGTLANIAPDEGHGARHPEGPSIPSTLGSSSMDAGVQAPPVSVSARTSNKPDPPPARAHPPVPMTAQGTLELRVVPESMFWLGRFQMGSTSKPPFALDTGTYTLRIVNAQLKKEETREITVIAGKLTRIEINWLK